MPWGILTGIRPVKIVHALLDEGKDEEYIKEKLKEDYYIKDDKIELALNIAKKENDNLSTQLMKIRYHYT